MRSRTRLGYCKSSNGCSKLYLAFRCDGCGSRRSWCLAGDAVHHLQRPELGPPQHTTSTNRLLGGDPPHLPFLAPFFAIGSGSEGQEKFVSPHPRPSPSQLKKDRDSFGIPSTVPAIALTTVPRVHDCPSPSRSPYCQVRHLERPSPALKLRSEVQNTPASPSLTTLPNIFPPLIKPTLTIRNTPASSAGAQPKLRRNILASLH
ncbi:hypothetical protein IE81DRAFT_219670 [Ceraceosorus guamensis]|uniref:Uncharacterized protein n=1 Tax=Ceraceosorus guamensis TaxID=1522189 RepID=A0A316VTG6_9BASI|nr:hypothetical protein IE81DRAFT_219670 [Ceraceosorus guamensis]PWN40514.1 hypothetical protein IE81DRAFT_219670 [Ceraceosorus guamensis]